MSELNKQKRRLVSCMILAMLSTGTGGCRQNFTLTNQTFVMELGTDVYANPALYLDDAEQINTSKLSVEAVSPGISITDNRFVTLGLDYLSVGEYEFAIVQGEERTPFVIKIKDTKPPTPGKTPKEVDLAYGQDVSWSEIFDASDLSGVYYEAPSDLVWNSQERDVEIKIRDRFGNSLSYPLHVRIH